MEALEIDLLPKEEHALDLKAWEFAKYLESLIDGYVNEQPEDVFAQMYLRTRIFDFLTGQKPELPYRTDE